MENIRLMLANTNTPNKNKTINNKLNNAEVQIDLPLEEKKNDFI